MADISVGIQGKNIIRLLSGLELDICDIENKDGD
jgi:hypothetical protein